MLLQETAECYDRGPLSGMQRCQHVQGTHALIRLKAQIGRQRLCFLHQRQPCGRAGFAVLGALATLHELSVANTAAGDASLATWGALTQLTRLSLDCTAVTNTCATCSTHALLHAYSSYPQSC